MEEPKYRNEGSGLVTCAQWETALVSWGAANASVSMLRIMDVEVILGL